MTWGERGGIYVNRSVHVVDVTTGTAVVVVCGSPYAGGQPGTSMRTSTTAVPRVSRRSRHGVCGCHWGGKVHQSYRTFRPPRTVAQMSDCSYIHPSNFSPQNGQPALVAHVVHLRLGVCPRVRLVEHSVDHVGEGHDHLRRFQTQPRVPAKQKKKRRFFVLVRSASRTFSTRESACC